MKKAIFAILFFGLLVSMACADCTVTVNWTPSADPNAASQEVWYFDGTADAMKASGDMSMASAQFAIDAPVANDAVWVRTKDAGTGQTDTAHIPVGGVAGATMGSIIVNCQ